MHEVMRAGFQCVECESVRAYGESIDKDWVAEYMPLIGCENCHINTRHRWVGTRAFKVETRRDRDDKVIVKWNDLPPEAQTYAS